MFFILFEKINVTPAFSVNGAWWEWNVINENTANILENSLEFG